MRLARCPMLPNLNPSFSANCLVRGSGLNRWSHRDGYRSSGRPGAGRSDGHWCRCHPQGAYPIFQEQVGRVRRSDMRLRNLALGHRIILITQCSQGRDDENYRCYRHLDESRTRYQLLATHTCPTTTRGMPPVISSDRHRVEIGSRGSMQITPWRYRGPWSYLFTCRLRRWPHSCWRCCRSASSTPDSSACPYASSSWPCR